MTWTAISTGKGTRCSAQRFQIACRSRAVDVFHRQEDAIAVYAGVEHRHQVAVRQPQRDHRLVAEAARVFGGDDLGRHLLDHAQLLEAGRARHARGKAGPCRRGRAAAARRTSRTGAGTRPGSPRICLASTPPRAAILGGSRSEWWRQTAVRSGRTMNGTTGNAIAGGGDAPLANRRIVLGVTGGIAAYKAAELVRLYVKAGATVRVVMTEAATRFITPLTLQTLSGAAGGAGPVRPGVRGGDRPHPAGGRSRHRRRRAGDRRFHRAHGGRNGRTTCWPRWCWRRGRRFCWRRR